MLILLEMLVLIEESHLIVFNITDQQLLIKILKCGVVSKIKIDINKFNESSLINKDIKFIYYKQGISKYGW